MKQIHLRGAWPPYLSFGPTGRRRTGQVGGWWVDGLILTSWLISVGLVVLHEQGLWGGMRRIPRTISAPLEVQEQWFGVYYQHQKVGFTHIMLMPDEQEGIPGFSIIDHGRLRFRLLGIPQLLEIRARAFIDADYQLRNFLTTVHAEAYSMRITGRRQGDELLLTFSSPTSEIHQRLRDPSGRIWMSALSSWVAFQKLEVGQWGRLWILNPLALKPEPVSFHVSRRESVQGQDALVIETDYRGMTATTWITPSGVVLKETSPMGWDLVQEPMEQALAIEAKAEAPIDLLSTVAVTVDRRIEDPARLNSLTMLVEGVGPDAFRVDRSPWQEMLSPDSLAAYGHKPPEGPWCIIRLREASVSPRGAPQLEQPKRFAMASLFVQSDDPLIRKQAREVVGALMDPWQQAVALHHWVYQTLAKRLTIGLPSAKDVLLSKAGDCHEHTVLFTALARSLGIPTRMVAGLVYYRDRFYYHAWPEVWPHTQRRGHLHQGHNADSAAVSDLPMQSAEALGVGWIPMDPTIGQVVADPTHVGLVEAEHEELVSLAQFVGKISLRVLEMQ